MGRLSTLVDTNVLSLALRRRPAVLSPEETDIVQRLSPMLIEGEGGLIGPIRQEILTGIRHRSQYDRLRSILDGVVSIDLEIEDFDEAARLTNLLLLARGVTVEDTDSLLAAAALRRQLKVLSLDSDLKRFIFFGLEVIS